MNGKALAKGKIGRGAFNAPNGRAKMDLGKGNQGERDTSYEMTKRVGGKTTLTNVVHYPAEDMNPPEGVRNEDRIRSQFRR